MKRTYALAGLLLASLVWGQETSKTLDKDPSQPPITLQQLENLPERKVKFVKSENGLYIRIIGDPEASNDNLYAAVLHLQLPQEAASGLIDLARPRGGLPVGISVVPSSQDHDLSQLISLTRAPSISRIREKKIMTQSELIDHLPKSIKDDIGHSIIVPSIAIYCQPKIVDNAYVGLEALTKPSKS